MGVGAHPARWHRITHALGLADVRSRRAAMNQSVSEAMNHLVYELAKVKVERTKLRKAIEEALVLLDKGPVYTLAAIDVLRAGLEREPKQMSLLT
jgi:hypothetical protein